MSIVDDLNDVQPRRLATECIAQRCADGICRRAAATDEQARPTSPDSDDVCLAVDCEALNIGAWRVRLNRPDGKCVWISLHLQRERTGFSNPRATVRMVGRKGAHAFNKGQEIVGSCGRTGALRVVHPCPASAAAHLGWRVRVGSLWAKHA